MVAFDDTHSCHQIAWDRVQQLVPSAPLGDRVSIFRVGEDVSFDATTIRRQFVSQLAPLAERVMDSLGFDRWQEVDRIEELCQLACAAFRPVQANALSTFIELVHLRGEITSWVDGIEDVVRSARRTFSPRRFARLMQAIGNLRLSTKWGLPLTVRDAREIANAFTDDLVYGLRRDRWQISRYHSDDVVPGRGWFSGREFPRTLGVKVLVSKYDNRATQAISEAFDYNLLSYGNVWDMIPYSFVVDWFTHVSDRIQLLDDTFYREAFLDVRGAVWTRKYSVQLTAEDLRHFTRLPFSASDLNLTLFFRDVSENLPWPQLEDRELYASLGFTQVLDGGTLVFQRFNLD